MTPNEIDRIISNLVSQIELKDRIIASLESAFRHQEESIRLLREMVDSANQRARTEAYIAEMAARD